MSERFTPRQTLQDPDLQLIGAFGGLSSASYQTTGDIVYCDKLTNAYVTNRNEIKRRSGSRVLTWLNGVSSTNLPTVTTFKFSFDGLDYLLTKSGGFLYLDHYDKDNNFKKSISKFGAFLSGSNSEQATIATVIESNICYILIATSSSPLAVGVLFKRSLSGFSVVNSTQFTGVISNYPATDVIANNNTFVYNDENGSFIRTTSLTQTGFNIAVTTASAHGLSGGSNVKIHSFFTCVGRSANYYPGNYLFNIAARKNAVPLDVNVQLPDELVDNPIVNESKLQNLGISSVVLFKTNSAAATKYTRVTDNQPNTEDEWEFSDGGFISGDPNIFTNRTPAFVSFGALQASGNTSQVYAFRLRQLLLVPNYAVNTASVNAYVDKVAKTPVFYDSTGTVSITASDYFSFETTNRPGLNLSAVVELIYNASVLVDMSADQSTIKIDDGYTIPLYGISAYCNVGSDDYLPIVASVGNRVVLSGYDNRVLLSNANWNYRGIGWNNFQVSTIDFQTNSAYAVSIGQNSSKVIGIRSVNGVLIVATDTGIFRISGENATLPPNATIANFSRLSNEVINNSDCILLYENKIFFVSKGGLYQLEYSRETEELLLTPISTQTSDYFSDKTPVSLVYSSYYRAFVVGFAETDELLLYIFESETFAVFKLACVSAQLKLCQTLDGFTLAFSRLSDGLYNFYHCIWDDSTTDLSNANGTIGYGDPAIISGTIITARATTVFSSPTDMSFLCTPAELVDLIDPGSNTLVLAYGDNHAKVTNVSSVNVSEYSGGVTPAPVLSYAVTKAYLPDKLLRSNRIRAVNLLVTGTGTIYSSLVFPNKDNSNTSQTIEATSVNSTGAVVERANVNSRQAVGDTVNIRMRHNGVADAWSIAMKITDAIKVLGWQLDTSAKKRGRLN